MSTKQKPYGNWRSPISSSLIAGGGLELRDLKTFPNADAAEAFWVELRFAEEGRQQVCSVKNGEIRDWLPGSLSARTRVHEYGLGTIEVSANTLFYSNDADGGVYALDRNEATATPRRLSLPDTKRRFADLEFSPKLNALFAVMEDHSFTPQAANSLIVISLEKENFEESILASGCDFYISPRVSPDGQHLAWIQWNHPNMPWNSTSLMVARLEKGPSGQVLVVPGSARKLAGFHGDSVLYPVWLSDAELLYVSDKSGYWNVYYARVDRSSSSLGVESDAEHRAVCAREQETGGPHWVFGYNSVIVHRETRRVFMIFSGIQTELVVAQLDADGVVTHECTLDTAPYSVLLAALQLHWDRSSGSGTLFALASSPRHYESLVAFPLALDGPALRIASPPKCIRTANTFALSPEYVSEPQEVKFPVSVTVGPADKQPSHAYGYYYPPKNPEFYAPSDEKPPLLVLVHGGPTANPVANLRLEVQYYTTRGFAVLDADYRGGTMRGRSYREALHHTWGIYDLADCCAGALWLCSQGLADRKRLFIAGGSAGGYATLGCLAFHPGVFAGGVSHYGIGDLELLRNGIHKFESHYIDWLVAPYPEQHDQWVARSPLYSVDKIAAPLLLLHGNEDMVVPFENSERMFKVVKEKGLPTGYVLFKGEQHGWRRGETVERSTDFQFAFFARIAGIAEPDVPAIARPRDSPPPTPSANGDSTYPDGGYYLSNADRLPHLNST